VGGGSARIEVVGAASIGGRTVAVLIGSLLVADGAIVLGTTVMMTCSSDGTAVGVADIVIVGVAVTIRGVV
jgi:hypothetical protein